MKKSRLSTLLTWLTAISVTLFIISFAVTFTLKFRPLYYLDIRFLHISEDTGYSVKEIRENYDALIDYNSLTGPDTLTFPTLAMSEPGRIHFEEVKRIFVFTEILCIVTFLISAILIVSRHLSEDHRFLKRAGILTLVIPATLGIILSVSWEWSFVTFHHLMFNNDYWLFNPATDPVITILPDTFFFHCAVMILAVVIIGSILCFLLNHRISARTHKS